RPGEIVSPQSLIARVPSAVFRALRTRATAPPGRASLCYRAPPAHTVRPALAAHAETACGDPAHRPPSPSRAAPDPPTGRASLSTARGACDTVPPLGRGMLGGAARLVP